MAQQGELPPIAERDKAIDDVLEQFYKSTDKKYPWLDKAAAPGAGALSMIGAGVGLIPGLGEAGKALKEMPMELSPRTRDSMVGRVGMGVGGILPAVLGGEVAGLGAAAAGASDAVASAVGVGAPAAVIGADAGKEAYARAIANGADENHALAAGVLTGVGTGAGMAIPLHTFMGQFLGKVNASGGGFLKDALIGAGTNVAATVGTKYFADQVAHNIGNDKQAADLMETLRELGPESALVGGIVSGLAIYAGKHGESKAAPEKALEVPTADAALQDAQASFKAPEAEQTQGQAHEPMRTENPEVPSEPAKVGEVGTGRPVSPIPDPTAVTPEILQPDTSRAQELLQKPTAELRTELQSRLQAEQAELRTQFPDKPESWYQKIEELRRNARDPQNLEGDKSALELKRLGVKTGDFKVEEIADALREKQRAAEAGSEAGKRAYAEKGRGAATAARAEAEQAALDGAVERVGQGPSYHPESQPQAPTSPRVSIGGGLEGSLANTLPDGAPTTNKQKVIDSFVGILRAAGSNSPLVQGKMPADAAGLFDALPNVVKIKKWGDLYVASHEVGHALERAVFGFDPQKSPWLGEKNQAGIEGHAQKELSRLGKALYGDKVPNGGYLREGFAEYTRLWLTNHEALMKEAPAFTHWFDREFLPSLDPSVMKSMLAAREQADLWRGQGSYKRMEEQIGWANSRADRNKALIEWARYMTSQEAWVDGSTYAKEFDRVRTKALGRPLKEDESLVRAIQANRARSAGVVHNFVKEGTTLGDGYTRTGKSLDEVFAPIRNAYREWAIYMWAKRTIALSDIRSPIKGEPDQLQSKAIDTGASLEDAHQVIADIEAKYPAMPKVAADFYAFHKRVIDYIASVNPEMGRVLRAMDATQEGLHPGGWEPNYVVLHRMMGDMDTWARSRRGPSSAGRVMKLTDAMTGSGRAVKDILPEMLKQMQSRIEAAHMRAPHDVMANFADYSPEMASPLLRVASPEHQLVFEGAYDLAKKSLLAKGDLSGEALDIMGSAMSAFIQPQTINGGKDVLYPIWRPEVRDAAGNVLRPAGLVPYEMNTQLYSAIMHLRTEPLNKWMSFLNSTKNIVVKGATGLSMPFGLIKNPQRDSRMFVLNTKEYANPAVALAMWSKYATYSFLDAATNGWYHSKMKDPYYEVYSGTGQEYNQAFQMNTNDGNAASAARRLFETNSRRMIDFDSAMEYAAKVVGATEKAGRVAEMRGVLKRLGWDGKSTISPEMIQQAVIEARHVTIDYTQAGELAGKINQVIPFFNSAIQGPVAMIRGAKHHPWRFAAILAADTAAGMALWHHYKDDEDYQQLPINERMRANHWKVNIDGQDVWARWQRPQETAMLQAVVEEFTDALYHNRPARLGDLADAAWDTAGPGVLPPIVSEVLGQKYNVDFHTGRPIVPDRLKNVEAVDQVNDGTTQAAAALGQYGISPLRADHFVRAFLGGAGQDVLNALFLGADQKGRQPEPANLPVVGVLFRRGGPVSPSSQALQDFYRQLDIVDGISKGTTHPETPEQARIRMMLQDYGAGIAALSYVRDTYLKTNAEREAAMREIIALAKAANEKAASKTWDPAGGMIAAQTGKARKTLTDLQHGKLPRNMR